MDFKKILMGLLSTAYKMDSEKIEELFGLQTEEELTASLLNADKDRVAVLSTPKRGQTFQDGYAKGKVEVLTQFETDIKTKFGVNADVTGVELVELVVNEKGKGKGGAAALTDDDVRKHPVYQTLESRLTTAVNEKETEWQNKYNQRETELTKSERKAKAAAKIFDQLDGLKPVLSTNSTVAQNQKEAFVKAHFGDVDFDFQANDRTIALDKDGKPMLDAHGNTVLLNDLVKQKAPLFFDFHKNNGGGNAGNRNDGNGGSAGGGYPEGISKPTTFEELEKIVTDETIPVEDRNKVMEEWDANNS